MSYPPPPGLNPSKPSSTSSAAQSHPSLPARPPPSAGPLPSFKPAFTPNHAPPTGRGHAPGTFGGFTGFKPRSVAGGNQDWRAQNPTVTTPSAPPAGFSTAQVGYGVDGYQQSTYGQQQAYYPHPGADAYAEPTPPQIRNPFPLPGQAQHGGQDRGGRMGDAGYDPELEAQIAQWQSAYASKDDASNGRTGGGGGRGRVEGPMSAGGANAIPLGGRGNVAAPLSNLDVASVAKTDTGVASVIAGADGKQKTVVRSGGGQTWQDPSLLEWDPAHFRLFIGNLAGEVTDESLLKAFSRYASVQKARVVRDKRTTKSKGYGFVSFSNGDDYFLAAKEMQGKYIGSHPVLVKRSTTEIRPTVPADKRKNGKGGKGGGGNGITGANTGAGIHKKQSKTKGGLKILG